MTQLNTWWVVASDKDPEHGWHWDQFFNHPADPEQPYDWGGPDWIQSNVSFARIKEMRRGDIVTSYQAGEGILGLAMLASSGYKSEKTDNYDTFDLSTSKILRFGTPIPYRVIRDHPTSREDFEFVRIAKQGSVFRVSSTGQARLLQLSREFNPSQAQRIEQFLGAD